ncbi:MAG: AAA family ATPase, partial [Opitutaceae bacterium]|nr:AAA family ATPase [Opitutaceae bacterium]
AGKVYQNDLARACRELGYTISQVQDDRGRTTGFELTEVSIELRQRFSKRRADIEKGIVDFEIKNGRSPSTAEIHAITVKTRNAKLAEISTTEVISNQRAQLSAAELKELHRISSEAVRSVELSGAKRSVPRERESLGAAIGHTFERRSVVYGHELLAEALNQNIGFLDLDALKIQASKTGLVPLAEGNQLCQPFATERGLHQERWAVNLINLTKGSGEPLSKRPLEEASILSVSQRTAINSLLSCRDQFQSLRGAAGVGKTTLLKELDEHLRSEGHRMIYCAPTTSAADTLRKDGLADATTVSDFLTNGCLEESKKLQGAVLVVDEAGLSSNNQGVSLMRIAKQNGARILFVGDSKQHTSVEAGDFLRVLESHSSIQRIELSSIRRQTDKNYRKAIQLMATGATKQGLEYLDQMKSISDDGPDYISKAVETYLRKTNQGQNHSAAIAVTPTWAENRAFTEALRTELKARGCIKASKPVTVLEPLPWTRSQARQASNYRPGMILDCTKNSPGFERGARFQVLDIAGGKVRATDGKTEKNIPVGRIEATISVPREIEVGEGDKILIRANDRSAGLKNGEVLQVAALESGKLLATDGRSIDTRMFKYFDHGFAVTSHKSQSKTAEHVVVAAAALDAKSTYVACSRGRRSCTLHTPDKEQLFDRLPEGNREAALDVLGKALPRPPHTNPPQDQSHKIEATQRAWGWWRRNLGRWFVGRESSESEHDRESRV